MTEEEHPWNTLYNALEHIYYSLSEKYKFSNTEIMIVKEKLPN